MGNVAGPASRPANVLDEFPRLPERKINAGDPGTGSSQCLLKFFKPDQSASRPASKIPSANVQYRQVIGLPRVGALVKSTPNTLIRKFKGGVRGRKLEDPTSRRGSGTPWSSGRTTPFSAHWQGDQCVEIQRRAYGVHDLRKLGLPLPRKTAGLIICRFFFGARPRFARPLQHR